MDKEKRGQRSYAALLMLLASKEFSNAVAKIAVAMAGDEPIDSQQLFEDFHDAFRQLEASLDKAKPRFYRTLADPELKGVTQHDADTWLRLARQKMAASRRNK